MPAIVSRRSRRTPKEDAGQTRILLFGDSHTNAVQRAIEKRKGKGAAVPLTAHRLLKEKNGRNIGDTSFEEFLKKIADLSAGDVVLSMIGGNQHSVYSLVKHPQPFDFFTADGEETDLTGEVVPYRALEEAFKTGLWKGDGKSLELLRKSTSARIVHIIPPPPKADNAFIEQNHESHFAEMLPARGVSAPVLRLKFWRLQTRILQQICGEIDIVVMMPPLRALDPQGYLRPEFYAQDATHGNWKYGERVLRQVEDLFLSPAERTHQSA